MSLRGSSPLSGILKYGKKIKFGILEYIDLMDIKYIKLIK